MVFNHTKEKQKRERKKKKKNSKISPCFLPFIPQLGMLAQKVHNGSSAPDVDVGLTQSQPKSDKNWRTGQGLPRRPNIDVRCGCVEPAMNTLAPLNSLDDDRSTCGLRCLQTDNCILISTECQKEYQRSANRWQSAVFIVLARPRQLVGPRRAHFGSRGRVAGTKGTVVGPRRRERNSTVGPASRVRIVGAVILPETHLADVVPAARGESEAFAHRARDPSFGHFEK
jgi:hypothetical protein